MFDECIRTAKRLLVKFMKKLGLNSFMDTIICDLDGTLTINSKKPYQEKIVIKQ